jgi:hypothetical protein
MLLVAAAITSSAKAQENSKEPIISGKAGFRTFWMATSYWKNFKDDFALGQAGFLQAQSRSLTGFFVGGGYTVFSNVWSSNLSGKDR